MADDTMEISSEHGHNIGDEDIDIDIDITASHVDEDYVLDDAASNVAFGDTFPRQPSPAMGHDDLMVDDGDESYPMHMDGADLMRDDPFHTMEDDLLEMSAAAANIPSVLVEESYNESPSQLLDGSMKDEVSWEANDEPDPAGNDASLADRETHDKLRNEDEAEGHVQETPDIEAVAAPSTSTPLKDSHPNTPLERSPKIHAVVEEPRSPPTSVSAPEADFQDHISDHLTEPSGVSNLQDSVSKVQCTTSGEPTNPSLIPDVVVVYQDSQYSLFSKSETDDIDSYFLFDTSVVDKPLGKLFKAIRDVILGDLSDEDELCISAADLGLDIEEVSCTNASCRQAKLTFDEQTSSLIGSVTLGQIISLHEKLLQNDGVESSRPLCLLLGTRPNFSTRFANLTSGASEGKGLSELVQGDEQSESIDDSAHVTVNDHGEELGENYENDEALEESGEKDETDDSKPPQQQAFDNALPQDEQNPPEEASTIESPNASEIAVTNEPPNHLTEHTAIEEVLPLQVTEATGSGEDEDGDLIDYSDAEDGGQTELRKDAKSRLTKLEIDQNRTTNGTFTDFIPPCLKPHTCFCSKCNDLLLAEYEAINEELRRRSISRSAEENLLEQTAEASVANDGTDYESKTNLVTENGVEHDEDDGDNFGRASPEHGDPSTDFGENHAAEFDLHEDEVYVEDGDVDGAEAADDHDLATEPTIEDNPETFDEFDFEEDSDAQHQRLPPFDGRETQPRDENANLAADPTAQFPEETVSFENSLVFTDAPDSESAASEKTLEAQPVAAAELTIEFNEENEDEIDYDDDEEQDLLQVQTPDVKEIQALSNGTGKRPRDDDGTSAESKGISQKTPHWMTC